VAARSPRPVPLFSPPLAPQQSEKSLVNFAELLCVQCSEHQSAAPNKQTSTTSLDETQGEFCIFPAPGPQTQFFGRGSLQNLSDTCLNTFDVCFASNLQVKVLKTIARSMRSKHSRILIILGSSSASLSDRTHFRKMHPKQHTLIRDVFW